MKAALRIALGIAAGAILAAMPLLHFHSNHAHDAQGGSHASHAH
jgi:hypothetical protein